MPNEANPPTRLVRLSWPVKGKYCQFEKGEVVKMSRHDTHARLERVQWPNSLTISNVLMIERHLIGYEEVEPEQTPDAQPTPAVKEQVLLEAVWEVLKKYEVTFDGGIRLAVRLIISCARGSNSAKEAFDYAQKLLSRAASRAE